LLFIVAVKPVSGRVRVREAPVTRAPLGSLKVPRKDVVATWGQIRKERKTHVKRSAQTTREVFMLLLLTEVWWGFLRKKNGKQATIAWKKKNSFREWPADNRLPNG
jgi:hypothetical protein